MKKVIFFLLLIPFITKAEVLKSEKLMEDNRVLSFSDSIVAEDGKTYLSGYGLHGFVMILDSNYEVEKIKEFDEYEICMAVQIDKESNVYALCSKPVILHGFGITNNDNTYSYFELVKLDKNLNVIYQKEFQSQFDRSGPLSMLIKNEQIYFVVREYKYDSVSREENGYVYVNYLLNFYLYKTNLDGEVIKKTPLTSDRDVEYKYFKECTSYPCSYGFGSEFGRYYNIIPIGDYLYICTNNLLSKVDYSGNKIWTIDISNEYGFTGSKITETNDGKIMLGGKLYRNNSLETIDSSYVPILVTLDSDTGEIIDYKLYKMDGYGEIKSVDNKDGGYYVSFNLNGAIEGLNDTRGIYYAKLDYNLNTKDVIKIKRTDVFYGGIAENGIYSYERSSLVNYISDFSGDITAEKTIKIDETISIAEILGVELTSSEWIIDNPSIIEIKDGVIIPKEIGSTYIRSTYENNDYSIKITVINLDKKENKKEKKNNSIIKNPDTYDYIMILVFILIAFLIITLVSRKFLKRTIK